MIAQVSPQTSKRRAGQRQKGKQLSQLLTKATPSPNSAGNNVFSIDPFWIVTSMLVCPEPECRGQEGGERQDSSNTFLILPSSYHIVHCSTLPTDRQKNVQRARTTSKVSRRVSIKVMGRLEVGRKALVLKMGEPMSSRRRKKTEQVSSSRRRTSGNNHNRLWRFCWQLFGGIPANTCR